MNQVTSILGWVLAVAATATVTPQLIHLLKGNKIGLEPLTPAIASVTMVSWVIFTSGIQDLPAFASSVGPLFIWVSILVLLAFHRVSGYLRAVSFTLILSGFLITSRAMHFLPFSSFGILAAFGSTIWALPQLVKVYKLRGTDISGVSSLAYLLLALENASWILYAVGTGTFEYALAPLVQLPACLVIALYARQTKESVS